MSSIENATDQARLGWAALLRGRNAVYFIVLAGGVTLHALHIYIVTTILPRGAILSTTLRKSLTGMPL